jgi:predicted RNA methylase
MSMPKPPKHPAPRQDESGMRFGFGENWADYLQKNFSDERVDIAREHLLGFLKLDSLKGLSFLDIGCGSGLHSLAAWRAGAEWVVSFDYDADSVATTQKLHALSGSPGNWTVMQGSVLDDAFLRTLPKADIVYSWGVLHHTGAMWQAIENAARQCHASSLFYIALYSSDVYVNPPAEYWLKVKKTYNRAGALKKRGMELRYAWRDLIKNQLLHGKNPLTRIRQYKQTRGMSYWHDVRDWLGGYPMEFAGNKETESFARDRLGLELVHLRAGHGNTEYLFRPLGARNHWDGLAQLPRLAIPGPYAPLQGHAWCVPLGEDILRRIAVPGRFMLYESDSPLGWPVPTPVPVIKYGRGRYLVQGRQLIFSTSDNTDPNSNGKSYRCRPEFL